MVPGPVLSTVIVRSEESVVFPTLSVARATMVYVPSAGCPLQVTEYGAVGSGAPMVAPEAKEQLAPTQKRNSTLSMSDPPSVGLAETVWPFAMAAPALGAMSEKAFGAAVSTVTMKLLEAVRPAPEKAVTVWEPERAPKP